MTISSSILNRVRETFGKLAGAASPRPRQSDFLVRMNLPPLMGRRDAAYDRACELLRGDLFALSELRRMEIYSNVADLFYAAVEDTRSILSMLSSPDTESRERQLLDFLTAINNAVETLEQLLKSESELFGGAENVMRFAGFSGEEQLLRDEQLIGESEISIVHRARAFIDNGETRITRYREYTNKSFSRSNSERYSKARVLYHELYVKNTTETAS